MFGGILNRLFASLTPLWSATHFLEKKIGSDWFSCNVNLVILKLKHGCHVLRLIVSKIILIENVTYLK